MPTINGEYVAPTWANDAEPPIDAEELQAMSDGIERMQIPAKKGTGEKAIVLNATQYNVAEGNNSLSEGYLSVAFGDGSHAEGFGTSAMSRFSHAEGFSSATADFIFQISSVSGNTVTLNNSFPGFSYLQYVESGDIAIADNLSYIYSKYTVVSADDSSITLDTTDGIGQNTKYLLVSKGKTSSYPGSHAGGIGCIAVGEGSRADGVGCIAIFGHAHGHHTISSGNRQSVFGKYNLPDSEGTYAEIVGNGRGENSRSNARTLDWNGNETLAGKLTLGADPSENMDAATKEYVDTAIENIPPAPSVSPYTSNPAMNGTASAGSSADYARGDHVHPSDTTRAPLDSPAFTGTPTAPTAARGTDTNQIATTSFVQGHLPIYRGDGANSIFIGASGGTAANSAYGTSSIAEGVGTFAAGDVSHACGLGTNSNTRCQFALGKYNNTSGSAGFDQYNDNFIMVVGWGTDPDNRANAFRVGASQVWGGTYSSSGADYAEMFEWEDGNPNDEDRAGRFVALDGDKIRLAASGDDFILGIVSGHPSVVGDVHDDQWKGMYLQDVYGRYVYETAEEDGGKPYQRRKLNPEYDCKETYQPRSTRKEWDAVGMMGKLVALDDGSCTVNGWTKPGAGGIATASTGKTRFRVMKRLDESHILILIL